MNHKNFFSVIFFLFLSPLSSFASIEPLEISGYYKNLLTVSNSVSTKEGIAADLQRFRLEFQKQVNPWQFHLALDNEAIFNDMAHTGDFESIRHSQQQFTSTFDWDKTSVDNDHLYLRHAIYRAYVKYYTPRMQTVVGKQAIDWGRLRFYSPADLFNPVSATSLEPDERAGVGAINVNISSSEFSGVNVVAAPGSDEERSSYGVKVYHKLLSYDCALIAARIHKRQVYGAVFDGYLASAGFRGEFTHEIADDGRAYPRAALGLDYTFNEKFYALMEYIFNGGAENDPTAFTSSFFTAQRLLSLRKQLSSLWLQYKITPLVEWNNYLIYDWEGRSVAFNPELKYNVTENVDVAAGVQLFWGNTGSEFKNDRNVYYLQVKIYF
jgi:hypothetical protein